MVICFYSIRQAYNALFFAVVEMRKGKLTADYVQLNTAAEVFLAGIPKKYCWFTWLKQALFTFSHQRLWFVFTFWFSLLFCFFWTFLCLPFVCLHFGLWDFGPSVDDLSASVCLHSGPHISANLNDTIFKLVVLKPNQRWLKWHHCRRFIWFSIAPSEASTETFFHIICIAPQDL